MHGPNKAESFTGWISAGRIFFLAFTCIPSFLLPPSRRMVHAPASPSASLSVPVPSKTVCISQSQSNPNLTEAQILKIHQVQQRGHIIWVTYFKSEHLPPSSHLDARIKFSRHECSWRDFQQLQGAEHAPEAAPGLEYRLRANIPEHQLQPSCKVLSVGSEEPACLVPDGYRISLPTKSNHIVPTTRRLYRITEVFEHNNEYYVEAEIFESYMKGNDSVQGLRKMVYTLSEFEATEFEHTSQYEKEYKKAMNLRAYQYSAKERQEELESEGWFGACFSFSSICPWFFSKS